MIFITKTYYKKGYKYTLRNISEIVIWEWSMDLIETKNYVEKQEIILIFVNKTHKIKRF